MSKIIDDMRKEASDQRATENAIRMLKKQYPLDDIAECSGLSIDEIEKIKEEIEKE